MDEYYFIKGKSAKWIQENVDTLVKKGWEFLPEHTVADSKGNFLFIFRRPKNRSRSDEA